MSNSIKYVLGNHTDVGKKREINQDSFGSAKNSWGELFIVADGMGGHQGGEVASKISVDILCSEFKNAPSNISPSVFLDKAIQNAHHEIVKKSKENSKYKGMGTTIVATIVTGNEAHIAHVGDSRVYLFRKKDIWFKTKDHSLVQNLINQGLLKEEDAESHPEKNKITQALGVGNVDPEITNLSLYKNDYLLMCSDGLTGELQDHELLEMVLNDPPMKSCKSLVDKANERGGPDNITVITVHITEALEVPKNLSNSTTASRRLNPNEKKQNFYPYIFISALVSFFFVFHYLSHQNLDNKPEAGEIDLSDKIFNDLAEDSTKKEQKHKSDISEDSSLIKSSAVQNKEEDISSSVIDTSDNIYEKKEIEK